MFLTRLPVCLLFVGSALASVTEGDSSSSTSNNLYHKDPSLFFGGSSDSNSNSNSNSNSPYLKWWKERGEEWFSNSAWLPSKSNPKEGVALHWSIDSSLTRIHIAVAAKATGWIGLGLSENGGMRGADVLLWEARNPNQLIDAHILDALVPIEDDCNDWQLDYSFLSWQTEEESNVGLTMNTTVSVEKQAPQESNNQDNFMILEATRLLTTGDTQDRSIIPDDNLVVKPTSIIAAWGDSETFSYHGPNRAQGSVRFFERDDMTTLEQFHKRMDEQADGYFFIRPTDYLIPETHTTYKKFCFDTTDLAEQGVPIDSPDLNIIGVEPIIDSRTIKYLHHFTAGAVVGDDKEVLCRSDYFRDSPKFEVLYMWAAGNTDPLILPSDVSYPMMDYTSFAIQIHYDNRDMDEGQLDSTGVKYYYTTKPKKAAAGIMPIGDVLLNLEGLPLGDGITKHQFYCPQECSTLTFTAEEPVTVFAEAFHMHQKALWASSRIIRNGEVVHSSRIDFWDFEQNGGLIVQQEPFVILPGDAFETTCYYESNNVTWGEGAEEEMCLSYLFHYPKQTLAQSYNPVCTYDFLVPQCSTQLESSVLADDRELGRIFGQEPGTCSEPFEYKRETVAEIEEILGVSEAGSDTTSAEGTSKASLMSHGMGLMSLVVLASMWLY